jgi:hypothetical protein
MILASDDWYANHNRFEERRHWLSHKIGQLQPSPLNLADLEAILDRPELLPPGCSATRIGKFEFKWTQPGLGQEARITCDPNYYEDNSDSLKLWVQGSPLFLMHEVTEAIGHSQTQAHRSELEATLGTNPGANQHR